MLGDDSGMLASMRPRSMVIDSLPLPIAGTVFEVIVQTLAGLHHVHDVVAQLLALRDEVNVEHAELITV